MKFGQVGLSVKGIEVQRIKKSFRTDSFMSLSLGWERFEKLLMILSGYGSRGY